MTPSRSGSEAEHPVRERVSRAEQLIAEGKYQQALNELRVAQAEEPSNKYIPALVERTIALLYPSPVRRDTPLADTGQSPEQESEQERRVRRLTVVAKDLFERGSYEMAFQTLVKAFQMAPTSPYVLECQKTLVPAMELLRKRGTVTGIHLPARRSVVDSEEREVAEWRRRIITAPQKRHEPVQDPQEARIEALRRKKEGERRERELAMWREAAKPPRLQSKGPDPAPETPESCGPGQSS